jgi:hypothetical protein
LNKLNSLHPRIISTKLDWIWLAGSREDFSIFSVYFYSFAITVIGHNYSPLTSKWRRFVYMNNVIKTALKMLIFFVLP